jgi:hypothetical protein
MAMALCALMTVESVGKFPGIQVALPFKAWILVDGIIDIFLNL